MSAPGWSKKRKGSGDIWTHPQLENAVVDTRGLGANARISYKNRMFSSVKDAKQAAMKDIAKEAE